MALSSSRRVRSGVTGRSTALIRWQRAVSARPTMLAATRDECVEAESGLQTATGQRSLAETAWGWWGKEATTAQRILCGPRPVSSVSSLGLDGICGYSSSILRTTKPLRRRKHTDTGPLRPTTSTTRHTHGNIRGVCISTFGVFDTIFFQCQRCRRSHTLASSHRHRMASASPKKQARCRPASAHHHPQSKGLDSGENPKRSVRLKSH
jgi:hypothetical protein